MKGLKGVTVNTDVAAFRREQMGRAGKVLGKQGPSPSAALGGKKGMQRPK